MSLAKCQVRFLKGKEKCLFSSSTSHVYVDQKDTAWLPIVSAIQTSAIIHRESLSSQVSILNTEENVMNYECGISIMVDPGSWTDLQWCPPAVLIKQEGVQGCKAEAQWDWKLAHYAGDSCPSLCLEFHVIHEINIPNYMTSQGYLRAVNEVNSD